MVFFFFNDTATTEIYTLSLHDALPICGERDPPEPAGGAHRARVAPEAADHGAQPSGRPLAGRRARPVRGVCRAGREYAPRPRRHRGRGLPWDGPPVTPEIGDPVAPALSVLVVNFNTRDLLGACLRSLPAALRRHGHEVIVADNGSTDGSVAMLRREWPSVAGLELGANLGFARANNRALARARGRYALLLNSDTEVQPDSLDRLVDFLDVTPSAGVAAPRLLNTDLSDQGTARAFPTPPAVLFGRGPPPPRP